MNLDDDVASAARALGERRRIGFSEAVNELVRAGLRSTAPRPAFRQRSSELGLRIDVSNVAEALDLLDGADAR